jgi:hypothetical protein
MRDRSWVFLEFVAAGALAAQPSANIPIRQVAPFEASSTTRMDPIVSVRALSDGRVIVTPLVGSKVLLLDRTLALATTIGDSTSLTPGQFTVPLVTVPYPADSTLLGDPRASVFILLDPNGKKVRTVAPPRSVDAQVLTGSPASGASLDPTGRLVYRGRYPMTSTKFNPTGSWTLPVFRDSFPIVRVDFEARSVDTIGVVLMPTGSRSVTTHYPDKPFTMANVVDPLPTDDWALLADGTVAIVRGHDYHVEFMRPDGKRMSYSKMPFDWRRLTDDDKRRTVDSMRTFVARADSISHAARTMPQPMHSEVVEANELPDYYPPLRQRGVMADRDGNVWILPSTSGQARGGLLYDVVGNDGALAERVQLPSGCSLAGFAPRNVVYLNCADSTNAFHLKRTSVRR